MRKKSQARNEALHHYNNSAVDGKHDDMPRHEQMYGLKQYAKDEAKFGSGIIKHDAEGKEIPQSDESFEAQKRMNANPEVGKEYYSRYKHVLR